jgi:hypothetical protein
MKLVENETTKPERKYCQTCWNMGKQMVADYLPRALKEYRSLEGKNGFGKLRKSYMDKQCPSSRVGFMEFETE